LKVCVSDKGKLFKKQTNMKGQAITPRQL